MNYNSGIEESLNKIFGGITAGCVSKDNPMLKRIVKESSVNLARFRGTFLNNIFQDEYAIMYSIAVDKGLGIATESMVEAILRNNLDLITDSPYVDLNRILGTNIMNVEHAPTDEEKAEVIISCILDKERELSNMYVSQEEFDSSIKLFVDWFKESYMLQISQNMTLIMSTDGLSERLPGRRKRLWRGSLDAKEYFSLKVRELDNLTDTKATNSVVINEEWIAVQDKINGRNNNQRLLKVGIDEVDKKIGWLRRGNMLGILGPPKGGKTSFTNYLVSNALDAGLNVAVAPLEGTVDEWMSKQIALRIRKDYGINLSSKIILELDFDGKENDTEKIEIAKGNEILEVEKSAIRKIVNAAKLRMAVDEKLGRLSFIDGALYCETCIEEFENHYKKENPFDILVIDSLINIGSLKGIVGRKSEVISNAYMDVKRYVSKIMKLPALAIVPAQLKQSTVDYLRKHPEATIEDTDGGESAETIRTPDEVVGIYSSKEEREAGMCKMYHVASRHSANFQDFYCASELSCSYFYSKPSLNE